MTVESPAFANQASSYPAEQVRRAVLAWCARTSANTPGIISGGLLSATDCQLSAPGSGMSVNVSTGEAIVGGSEGGVQGGYGPVRVSSTTNLAISTANPTNPRIDTVCVTIADAGYTEPTGVSGNAAVLQVVTGTPTSGANLTNLSGKATLPLSSLLLGYVLVPNSASNIITADIANVASVVNLGAAGLNCLRFLTPQNLHVVLGQSSITWPGATQYSNTVTLTHNIGGLASPYLFLSITQTTSSFTPAPKVTGDGVNSATVRAGTTDGNPPNGDAATLFWMAIG